MRAFMDVIDISCGVKQLWSLGYMATEWKNNIPKVRQITVEEIVVTVAEERQASSFCMVIFSDVVKYGNGTKLAEYVTEHNLGEITASPQKRNPNSNNTIQTWIWTINLKNLKTWHAKHLKENPNG